MTIEEANKIFEGWKEYIEINDKLGNIFTSIPESFLPYPSEVLEEVLNIIAKKYFDEGNYKMSKNVQENMSSILRYKDDEEAIKDIIDSFILKNPQLRNLHIENLKRARDSWAKIKV